MKAIRTHQTGGPETLTLDEVETPTPGKGEVLVAVKACAINYPDGLIIRDMYQFKPQRPFSPGGEISGVIGAEGEGGVCKDMGDNWSVASYHKQSSRRPRCQALATLECVAGSAWARLPSPCRACLAHRG